MTEGVRRRVAPNATGEGGSTDVPQHSESGLHLFSLMEDINDRLKLLNYEQSFLRANLTLMLKPLNRLYFALPQPASEQFPYFSHLTAWLLNLCHRDTLTWGEFDDPNTIAAAIAEEVKRMGCKHEARREGLRQGWGEAVLLLLDWLTQRALEGSGFTVMAPVYGSAKDDGAAAGQGKKEGEGGDENEADEDEVVDTVDDDAFLDDDEQPTTSLNDPFAALAQQQSTAPQPPPQPTIDPTAWALEFEQSAPLLRANPANTTTKEWRTHLDTSQKHAALLTQLTPPLLSELERQRVVLSKCVERIGAKERWMNKEYEALVEEMRSMSGEMESTTADYNKLTGQLSQFNSQLTRASEECEEMKDKISGRNEQMTDSTPVRALARSVKQLRQEVTEMEVHIGILSHTVSTMRQRRGREKEAKRGAAERERGRKGNGKNGAGASAGHRNDGQKHVHVRMEARPYDY